MKESTEATRAIAELLPMEKLVLGRLKIVLRNHDDLCLYEAYSTSQKIELSGEDFKLSGK